MRRSVLFVVPALMVLAACNDGPAHSGATDTGSPGIKSTAYLPPSPNEAGTGTNDMNSSLAVVGGQTTDASNPTPSGLPAASAALN